jgi:tRNA threonylcarbamoyladenosine biosynthesis protein TsaB
MISLAIDTCESRGSVAIRSDGVAVATFRHDSAEDYSSWLLPTVDFALRNAALTFADINLIAVATGPGSFTGVRVGLTSAKAWGEVYKIPLVGVSRLEAMASHGRTKAAWTAAFFDAHRGQIFAALYRSTNEQLELVESDMVTAPVDFLRAVTVRASDTPVRWISFDPQLLTALPEWNSRAARNEQIDSCPPELGSLIGEIAEQRVRQGLSTDAMHLDANYVRRSDAELFWKGPASVSPQPEVPAFTIRALRPGPEDAAAASVILLESKGAASWPQSALQPGVLEPASATIFAFFSEIAGRPTGFIIGRYAADEAEILNLAVSSDSRRQGHAKALVQRLLVAFCEESAVRVFLEVRESNSAAIALYEKLGFRRVGQRQGYYREPAESALVYSKLLDSTG